MLDSAVPDLGLLLFSLTLQSCHAPLKPLQLHLLILNSLISAGSLRLCLSQLLLQQAALLCTQLQLLLILQTKAP